MECQWLEIQFFLGLRESKLQDIQDETWAIADWSWMILEADDCGEKAKYSWAYKWWLMDELEMRLLRGVVYVINSMGPSTEPCGTPQGAKKEDDVWPEEETMNEREER